MNHPLRLIAENAGDWIALIDAKPLTRTALALLLETKGNFNVLSFASTDDFLSKQSEYYSHAMEIVIFNIGTTAISTDQIQDKILKIKHAASPTPLVVVFDSDETSIIQETLRYGVQGYIPTTLNPTVMIQVLNLVRVGGTYIPSDLLLRVFPSEPMEHPDQIPVHSLEDFTPRQLEVLQLLCQGKSNKVIAYDLEMQESTVKVHVREIMKKLNANNRTQAAFLAQRLFKTKEFQMKQDTREQFKLN